MFKSLYGHMPSLLMSKYLRVEWLGCMVGIYLSFSATAKLFSKVVAIFYISTSSVQESLPNLTLSVLVVECETKRGIKEEIGAQKH